MAWQLYAAYGVYLGAKYIYNRLTAEPPIPPKPDDLKVPTTAEGVSFPLIYGRTLVRQPVLAWAGNADYTQRVGYPDGTFAYEIDLLFVAGIPFRDGSTYLWGIYVNEKPLVTNGLGVNPFPPNFGDSISTTGDTGGVGDTPEYMAINWEFGGGHHLQDFSTSDAASRMTTAGVPSTLIPSYRGLSTLLVRVSPANQANIPPIAIEVSSIPLGFSTTNGIGSECNPMAVIEDLLTGFPGHGKLGLDASLINTDSFEEAAQTLKDEGNGYSRCIDGRVDALEVLNEILDQIDGVLYQDLSDGLDDSIKIKLIRGDYTPSSLPHITSANCSRVENFSISTLTGAINKVRVVFTDREEDYADNSATASDDAGINAVGGRVNEAVLRYPGVCTKELAEVIAARELAARATPLARCRAVVDRTFLRVNPGDAIKVTWAEYGLSSRVFRVVNVDRGTLENGAIVLDLVEDFFVVRRGIVLPGGEVTPFPVPDLPAVEE